MVDGQKFDADKVRIELFPGDALFAISQVLTFGAKKYTPRGWESGISWGRVFGAAMRHAWSWWQGRGPTNKSFLFGDLDEESKFSHLWHLGCCVVFLIAYEMRGMKEWDDRPAMVADSTLILSSDIWHDQMDPTPIANEPWGKPVPLSTTTPTKKWNA